MYIFQLKDKIYAAWDNEHLTNWGELDVYDASPDGISGKKEGFYFANWLMPFVKPFKFNTVSFSPEYFPGCLDTDSFPCKDCQFYEMDNCPILLDRANIQLTRKGFEIYRIYIYCPKGGADQVFVNVRRELLAHGKPLHYQVLLKILKRECPSLIISDRKLLRTLKLNPIYFQKVDEGVFQAVPNIPYSGKDGEQIYIQLTIDDWLSPI